MHGVSGDRPNDGAGRNGFPVGDADARNVFLAQRAKQADVGISEMEPLIHDALEGAFIKESICHIGVFVEAWKWLFLAPCNA